MTDHIPGVLTIEGREGWRIPLVLDSPHSGTEYPADFGHIADPLRLRWAEDTHVHDLWRGALDHGAVLLHAHFPRSYIDANRAETDMDPADIDGTPLVSLLPGEKSRLGIGLCWTKVPPDGLPLYAGKLTAAMLDHRITTYHRPYHAALQALTDHAHQHWGQVWHIDCHSMQDRASAMSTQAKGTPRPDLVIGDRDGTTCDPRLTALVRDFLAGRGFKVTVNDPYKGVELVRRHGQPAQGRHSIQIEVNRRLHMDEETREPNEGYAGIKALFTDLSGEIATFIKGVQA
ncbi:MAG: N-formylglutamate amidohydrolase [Paracoccus sp. (in: a-proteobacteria)]|uniref:N-formylglutamate amidohydrolase n=1 Tax=Paracoccus sp. TaxID=267 RepID=UPI0026DFE785|nr:N-formylglutamate amidohydrolase [Paracoccus sp. (in: a-proteobacteria)]MDO5620351.1 N-formylglutamate amidohydrolase [Paracoccus sp. (in: a-proteobacteria)]